jgi:RNA polymerase sigma-70 factor (ECF subfamily)
VLKTFAILAALANFVDYKMAMKDCNIFEVWENYKAALYLFILKKVKDEDASKDILQDVLLKSYQYCSKGKTVIHLKSWLFKIAINTIIDHLKKENRHQEINAEPAMVEQSENLVGEASVYIKTLLKLLPNDYAAPLEMYDLQNMSQKDIAVKLGLSLTNTKTRIQRARIKLKERFLHCCYVSFNENGEMISFDIKPHCKELQAEKVRLENLF